MADLSNDNNSSTPTLIQNYSRSEIDLSVKDTLTATNSKIDVKKDDESKIENDKVKFLQLFRYATLLDKLMMFFGSIGAIVNGASMPLMTIIFSDFIQAFANFTIQSMSGDINAAAINLKHTIRDKAILLAIFGVAVFIVSYIQMSLWMITGERQAKVIL